MSESHLRRGNLLWEGSRMMLPEHKEQLLGHRRDLKKKSRPHHDEQRLEQWSQVLADSMTDSLEIAVSVYQPLADERLLGTVQRIDPQQRQIKLLLRETGEAVWVRLSEVTGIDWP